MSAIIKPDAGEGATDPASVFPPAFTALLKRAEGSGVIRRASWPEIVEAVAIASSALPIAALKHVHDAYERCADGFRLIDAGEGLADSAMLAHLTLNARGVAALLNGRFDGLQPRREHLAAPGEVVEGLYLWLLFAPGRLGSGVRLIADAAAPALAAGVPVFARPLSRTSANIMDRMGALSARQVYPGAPEWLSAVLPTAVGDSRARLQVGVVRTMDDLARVFSIRTAAFMVDQLAGYEEEFDGNDLAGTHLLATFDGEPAGCARIRYFGDFAKFERFAILNRFRRSMLMPRLARACIEHVRAKGFTRVYAHARADLVPVWARFGARSLGRPPFRFSDIEFHELVLDLEPSGRALSLGADPLLLNRPEGAWDEIGPIDRSQLRQVVGREEAIFREVKRFRG